MRFHFDERKSARLRANPKRGVGFEQVQEVFWRPYYIDQRSDLSEQYRAIGWVVEQLYTVIFEMREDEEGEYYHLVTLWNQPIQPDPPLSPYHCPQHRLFLAIEWASLASGRVCSLD